MVQKKDKSGSSTVTANKAVRKSAVNKKTEQKTSPAVVDLNGNFKEVSQKGLNDLSYSDYYKNYVSVKKTKPKRVVSSNLVAQKNQPERLFDSPQPISYTHEVATDPYSKYFQQPGQETIDVMPRSVKNEPTQRVFSEPSHVVPPMRFHSQNNPYPANPSQNYHHTSFPHQRPLNQHYFSNQQRPFAVVPPYQFYRNPNPNVFYPNQNFNVAGFNPPYYNPLPYFGPNNHFRPQNQFANQVNHFSPQPLGYHQPLPYQVGHRLTFPTYTNHPNHALVPSNTTDIWDSPSTKQLLDFDPYEPTAHGAKTNRQESKNSLVVANQTDQKDQIARLIDVFQSHAAAQQVMMERQQFQIERQQEMLERLQTRLLEQNDASDYALTAHHGEPDVEAVDFLDVNEQKKSILASVTPVDFKVDDIKLEKPPVVSTPQVSKVTIADANLKPSLSASDVKELIDLALNEKLAALEKKHQQENHLETFVSAVEVKNEPETIELLEEFDQSFGKQDDFKKPDELVNYSDFAQPSDHALTDPLYEESITKPGDNADPYTDLVVDDLSESFAGFQDFEKSSIDDVKIFQKKEVKQEADKQPEVQEDIEQFIADESLAVDLKVEEGEVTFNTDQTAPMVSQKQNPSKRFWEALVGEVEYGYYNNKSWNWIGRFDRLRNWIPYKTPDEAPKIPSIHATLIQTKIDSETFWKKLVDNPDYGHRENGIWVWDGVFDQNFNWIPNPTLDKQCDVFEEVKPVIDLTKKEAVNNNELYAHLIGDEYYGYYDDDHTWVWTGSFTLDGTFIPDNRISNFQPVLPENFGKPKTSKTPLINDSFKDPVFNVVDATNERSEEPKVSDLFQYDIVVDSKQTDFGTTDHSEYLVVNDSETIEFNKKTNLLEADLHHDHDHDIDVFTYLPAETTDIGFEPSQTDALPTFNVSAEPLVEPDKPSISLKDEPIPQIDTSQLPFWSRFEGNPAYGHYDADHNWVWDGYFDDDEKWHDDGAVVEYDPEQLPVISQPAPSVQPTTDEVNRIINFEIVEQNESVSFDISAFEPSKPVLKLSETKKTEPIKTTSEHDRIINFDIVEQGASTGFDLAAFEPSKPILKLEESKKTGPIQTPVSYEPDEIILVEEKKISQPQQPSLLQLVQEAKPVVFNKQKTNDATEQELELSTSRATLTELPIAKNLEEPVSLVEIKDSSAVSFIKSEKPKVVNEIASSPSLMIYEHKDLLENHQVFSNINKPIEDEPLLVHVEESIIPSVPIEVESNEPLETIAAFEPETFDDYVPPVQMQPTEEISIDVDLVDDVVEESTTEEPYEPVIFLVNDEPLMKAGAQFESLAQAEQEAKKAALFKNGVPTFYPEEFVEFADEQLVAVDDYQEEPVSVILQELENIGIEVTVERDFAPDIIEQTPTTFTQELENSAMEEVDPAVQADLQEVENVPVEVLHEDLNETSMDESDEAVAKDGETNASFWEKFVGNPHYGHVNADNEWVWHGAFDENENFVLFDEYATQQEQTAGATAEEAISPFWTQFIGNSAYGHYDENHQWQWDGSFQDDKEHTWIPDQKMQDAQETIVEREPIVDNENSVATQSELEPTHREEFNEPQEVSVEPSDIAEPRFDQDLPNSEDSSQPEETIDEPNFESGLAANEPESADAEEVFWSKFVDDPNYGHYDENGEWVWDGYFEDDEQHTWVHNEPQDEVELGHQEADFTEPRFDQDLPNSEDSSQPEEIIDEPNFESGLINDDALLTKTQSLDNELSAMTPETEEPVAEAIDGPNFASGLAANEPESADTEEVFWSKFVDDPNYGHYDENGEWVWDGYFEDDDNHTWVSNKPESETLPKTSAEALATEAKDTIEGLDEVSESTEPVKQVEASENEVAIEAIEGENFITADENGEIDFEKYVGNENFGYYDDREEWQWYDGDFDEDGNWFVYEKDDSEVENYDVTKDIPVLKDVGTSRIDADDWLSKFDGNSADALFNDKYSE
ncbi:EAGR box-containing protein [Mycoplasma amphoriforme]